MSIVIACMLHVYSYSVTVDLTSELFHTGYAMTYVWE